MKTITIFSISILIAAPMSTRAADAKTNWTNNCAQCHGPDGKANTKMGKTLSAKDLTDPKVQAEFTDAKATQSIKEGVKQKARRR
jgi:mono/diheme cytochrome c family protein